MKSRSHRLSVSESHDDWVDESWTVDCVCGVNFDDGEEMVNCDECGVWVHTGCSRYVKSEKSFACDKCKNKNNGDVGIGNDSEETEVAEFLVELPTKTLRMGHPNTSVSSARPGRLWTDIPIEERVHVQGIPGGDPGLFSGTNMLSVLGPELWKSTGYVPKKFNFRYSEFPGMSGFEVEEKKEELINRSVDGHAIQADNEAGALLFLSKGNENILPIPVVDAIDVKHTVEGGGCHGLMNSRKEKLNGQNPEFACSGDILKEQIEVQPILMQCSNHQKESFGMSKDQNMKKKGRDHEKLGDVEKQSAHSHVSKEAYAFSNSSKQLEISQDMISKVVTDGAQCGRDALDDHQSDEVVDCATNIASNLPGPASILNSAVSSDEMSKERNKVDHVPLMSESLTYSNSGAASLIGVNGSRLPPVKEELSDVLQSSLVVRGRTGVGFGAHERDPLVVDVTSSGRKTKESKSDQDPNMNEASSWPNKKLKAEIKVDGCEVLNQALPLDAVKLNTMKPAYKHPESSANILSENCKANKTSVVCSELNDLKMHDSGNGLNADICKTDKSDNSSGYPYQSKREPTCSEASVEEKKKTTELGQNPEMGKEILQLSDAVTSHGSSSHRKVMVSMGKSTTSVMGTDSSGTKNFSDIAVKVGKSNSSTEKIMDEGKCVRSKKLVKEPSRLVSLSEKSQASKLLHTSDSRRVSSSTSKDSNNHKSSKLSLAHNANATSGFGEYASSSQPREASNVRNKASGSSAKDDKFYHSGSQPSSRGNVASMAAPSTNVPAGLSDEELALLLHQELNSSPRVPRVPRMRHTGSLPQIGCPTASSTLMKRTSSSGGKDQGMAFKRRTKEFSREGSHRPKERDNGSKKMDQKPSSPDSSRRESNSFMDRIRRRERDDGFVKGVHSMKMTGVSSSLSSSSDGHNAPSSHPTSRNSSDDGPRMFSHQNSRTLPGLIAEIMSEGKRMTYEELCNAVLPHWPHLRKHNGERYAYSSHSQAVLDCLRNRSEWARLVDRGPKTSGSRKRRKFDTDSVSVESEDNEDSGENNSKDVGSKSFESPQEDFPKGKRNARKRRRLPSRGIGVIRRRRADVVSDDESESLSNSSEDNTSSEEGGETSGVGSEASASSEEVR